MVCAAVQENVATPSIGLYVRNVITEGKQGILMSKHGQKGIIVVEGSAPGQGSVQPDP